MSVILYTTHCAKCNILQQKLTKKHVSYDEITDIEVIKGKGIQSVPMLEVDNKMMSFIEANSWVNSLA